MKSEKEEIQKREALVDVVLYEVMGNCACLELRAAFFFPCLVL